jgi:hypothetical protein
VEVVHSADFWDYYRQFNRLLADTDVLWTKPSEMVFYAALGLPLVLDDPVGHHEWHNRRWIVSAAVGTPRPELGRVGGWLADRFEDGSFITLARTAERALPRTGCERIAAVLRSEFTDR